MTRIKSKECSKYFDKKDVLYRCRYDEIKKWTFLCGECLKQIKSFFKCYYQYGGTWKSKRK